jgi:hypothetical protein
MQSIVPAAVMSQMAPFYRHQPLHPHIQQALNLLLLPAKHLIMHPHTLLRVTPRICHRKRRFQPLPCRKLFLQLKDIGKPLLIPEPHPIELPPLWIKPPSCLQNRFVMSRIILRVLATVLATPLRQLPKVQSPKPPLLGLARRLFSKK